MRSIRKIFILGGATLFGKSLIKYGLGQGYEIRAVDLIKPDDLGDFDGLDYIIEDFFKLSDSRAISLIGDCDSFVYAGGVDDMTVPKGSAGKFFYERNSLATGRMARLSAKAGVENFLILSDYRLEFAEKNEILRKNNYHREAYIETKFLQEKIAFYEGDGLVNVSSLRPGLVVGPIKRSPLCVHVDLIRGLKNVPVTRGVVPIISAGALAEAAILALELENDKKTYALATSNISYKRLYEIIIDELGGGRNLVEKDFDDLYPFYEEDKRQAKKKGLDHGIDPVSMLRTMDMDLSMESDFDLGEEDLEEDIRNMVKAYISE